MTDRPTDPDELVSAVADSEASPHEVELVASDVDLSARVREVQDLSRRHRDLARSEVATSGDAEARIAAAVASFGADNGATPDATAHPLESSTPSGTGDGAARVVPLGSPRRRRRAPAVASGIAAAIVLVVIGVVAMRNTGSSDTMAGGTTVREPATATEGADAIPRASTTAPAAQMRPTVEVPTLPPGVAGENPEGGAAMTTVAPPGPIPFLGEFDDLDQVVRAAKEQVDEAAEPDRPSSVCPAVVTSAPGARIARATIRGMDRIVVIRASTVTVLDPTTCRVLAP